jgi:uncharacterized protein
MFRILSLDGGGIKGAFTASVLATLERLTGQRAIDHFDLIAGTSTGGIIAIGLALGIPASEIRDFYSAHGPTIFPATGLRGRFWQLFKPKYSHEPLRAALTEILGQRQFGEAQTRLVIPTYDANWNRIYVMKTAHHPRFVREIDANAVDVAMATAAAPTYFRAASFPHQPGSSYVDGGVWANCPAMVGVTEAMGFLGLSGPDIDVLSVGTTSSPFTIADKGRAGVAQWNVGILNLVMEGQVEAARAQAGLLVGGKLLRIDRPVEAGRFALDTAKPETIAQLIDLGDGAGTEGGILESVMSRFLNGQHREPFVPYRAANPIS